MIAMLFATHKEAVSILSALTAKKVAESPFETYWFGATSQHPAGVVMITGMGPSTTASAVRHVIDAYDVEHMINAGIGGALQTNLAVSSVYRITNVMDGDNLHTQGSAAKPALPIDMSSPTWHALPTARLVSVEKPVFGDERREALATTADIVDMEGYTVAQIAAEHAIPCTLIKGISDAADKTGAEDLHRNLEVVSDAVCTCLLQGLAQWSQGRSWSWQRLANFVKVEHTIFSLPLLFAGAWIANGQQMPPIYILLLVALAGLGARTLGMAMNRILDRQLDLLNPRTAARDLPAGRMTLWQGWTVAGLGLLAYLIACAVLGPLCLRLSPIPAVVLVGYSLLKRFTSLCHFGIGVALGLGPLGAYVAVTGNTQFNPAILILAAFTFLWISGFDIIYALQDMEADRRNGIHSLPALLGYRRAQFVAGAAHAVAAVLAVFLWRQTGGGLLSLGALVILLIAFLLAYCPRLPLTARFFPVSAIAGVAGAFIPILGGIL